MMSYIVVMMSWRAYGQVGHRLCRSTGRNFLSPLECAVCVRTHTHMMILETSDYTDYTAVLSDSSHILLTDPHESLRTIHSQPFQGQLLHNRFKGEG